MTSITDDAWDGPVGLALDGQTNRLFMGDANTGRLWAIDLATRQVTELGAGGFNIPWGLALSETTLFVAEHGGLRIQAVDLATGVTTLVTGTGIAGSEDGPAAEASFQGPLGLAWNVATGTLFIADFAGHTVRALDVATQKVTTVAGNGTVGSDDGFPGKLNGPSGLVVEGGRLFITDTGNHTLRTWDMANGLTTAVGRVGTPASIGAGPGVPVNNATMTSPEGLAAGVSGLYVSVEYSVMLVPWAALEEVAP